MASVSRTRLVFGIAAIGIAGAVLWRPDAPVDAAQTPMLPAMRAAPLEEVETLVLGRGETISLVFARASIGGNDLANLLLGLREFVNPRRLTAGVEVTFRRWAATGTPRVVDVRLNADSTLSLAYDGVGWRGSMHLTPVVVDTVYAAGTIEKGRTLYEALVYDETSNLPPRERDQLVYDLAAVYEYKLDFTREIQPGDQYRLVYEREARPDGTARDRRILAAELTVSNKAYPAVWFEYDEEIRGYYDREGRPLKTGFSRYPVDFYRITSSYSTGRYHPVLGVYRAHLGTDFGAGAGTPVRATADGRVVFAGVNGGYGNLIRIQHNNGFETRYAHLSRFASGVRTGARVTQKQVIGYVGSTGLATGPHLHYELRRNGEAINALSANLPDAPPLEQQYLPAFHAVADVQIALLDDATARYVALTEARRAESPNDVP